MGDEIIREKQDSGSSVLEPLPYAQVRRAACGDNGVIQDVIKVRKWPAFFRLSPSVFF